MAFPIDIVDDVPVFDPGIFGCGDPSSYTYGKVENSRRVQPIKGRSRYRPRDIYEPYRVNISYVWTRAQYEAFQLFYANDIEHGNRSFVIRLLLGNVDNYATVDGFHQVRMVEPYSAVNPQWDLWNVSLILEVKNGVQSWRADCPEVYGGPIDALAVDDIYGGPIDSLANDIIMPCPGIDPSGVDL